MSDHKSQALILDRPLVFFDLETTGTNISRDRIVEISILKRYPDGESYSTTQRIHPTIPIPEQASLIHDIYDQDVKDKPNFAKIARRMFDVLYGCDLAGYNCIKFDIPMLAEEFARVGIQFPRPDVRVIDAYMIYSHFHKRTLQAALKHYTGEELTEAHQAQADTEATYKVIMAQVREHREIGNTLESIATFCASENTVDQAGKLIRNEQGDICFNFSKYKGQPVKDNLQFARWMLEQDFTVATKQHIAQIIDQQRSFCLAEDRPDFK